MTVVGEHRVGSRRRWPRGDRRLRRIPGVVPAGAQVLPGYRVVDLLAHGRRIDTYDAYSLERDCRCVVKILRPDRQHDQRVREAVLREGRLVCELTHPNLVRGYEVHEQPAPAIVLETLGGDTLGALLDDGPLTVPDVARLGLQLASALGYLHRRGWLHLDLKPPNIVIDGGRAILIDLSLADTPGTGRPGAGTPGYLSPEQAAGRNLGPHSDVWGLAVNLFEALTGEPPFGDDERWEGRATRRPLGPGPPRALPRLGAVDVPADLVELLRACLARDPAARVTLPEVTAVLDPLAR